MAEAIYAYSHKGFQAGYTETAASKRPQLLAGVGAKWMAE